MESKTMTELDLYKWVQKWEPEWRWELNDETKEPDVVLWISIYSIESFYEINGDYIFSEGGISARLVDKSIAIWMSSICDHYAIDLEKVFPKEN